MYCKCILFQLDIRKYYVLQKKLFLPYFSTSLLTGDAKVVPKLDVMWPGLAVGLFRLDVRGKLSVYLT